MMVQYTNSLCATLRMARELPMFLNSILTLYILGSRLVPECESTVYIWVISARISWPLLVSTEYFRLV